MSSGNDSKPDNYQINARICRLVERYPCMYDRSHPQYLKKDVVDKAWVKIAKEMEDSISSCKERWRNIRTSFARSINVNKIPASANRTKPYYLHEELQFLARHITPGIPVSRRSNAYYSAGEESEVIEVSVGEESFDDFAAMMLDEDDSQGHQSSVDGGSNATNGTIKSELKLPAQQPTLPEEEEGHEAEAAPAPARYTNCPPKKRQRLFNDDDTPPMPAERETDIKTFCPTTTTTSAIEEMDFDASFLKGLLPEMKAMDFRQKIQFKRRIYDVIVEIFDNRPTTNTQATPTYNGAIMAKCITAAPTTTPAPVPIPTYAGAPTMAVVNAADLAMIRRLNNLLQGPNTATSTVTAVPKNVASISSTVRSSPSGTATVAVHRGALTRSSTNLLRVTMVNPPLCTSTPQQQVVKLEPEVLED